MRGGRRGRPIGSDGPNTTRIIARCGDDTLRHLMYLKKYTGKSRSEVVRDAIEFRAMHLKQELAERFGDYEDPIYDDYYEYDDQNDEDFDEYDQY